MTILESLLNGEYASLMYAPTDNEEYRNLTKKFSDAEKAFMDTLNKEQLDKYYKCITLLLSREGVCAQAIFESAFALGANAMREIMEFGK